VYSRSRKRYCDGRHGGCEGDLGEWELWEKSDSCFTYEGCVLDQPSCECQITAAWDPTLTVEVKENASRYDNQDLYGIAVPLRVEIMILQGEQLTFRVCDAQDPPVPFQEPLYAKVVSVAGDLMLDQAVPANGSLCTEFVELDHDTGFEDGQVLDVRWHIVDSSAFAGQWTDKCLSVGDSAQGTCWWDRYLMPPLRRTCALH